MRNLKIISSIFLVLCGLLANAQEFRCKVTVNADKVQLTNKRIFKTLETAANEFVNNKTWTKDNFSPDERIECAMLITINSYTAPDQFTANIQINSSRTIFNTGYNSPLFSARDQDFNFAYAENAALEFTPDQFRSNLSSVMAYYIYIILGMDYDSFSQEGGTPYFTEAQRIVSNAQNSPYTGWTASESTTNRYWIVDNLLQTAFLPLRNCMYNYHLNGLDVMFDNAVEGRKVILASLAELRKVQAVKPLSYSLKLFFQTKVDELIGIFSKADQAEKDKFLGIVKELDPLNTAKYNGILKPN